jgi:hypothetical protein
MPDRPPLRDYSRSRAVLIGTWDYAFLPGVPAAEHSLRRMAGLLAGPLCGWPRDRLLLMENEPGPGDLPDRLITAFDDVSDVALFYFVGHGQLSSDDELCLGLVQSRPDPRRRAATSLRFSDVRQALRDSDASIKIVILDCCFAGLATTGAGVLAGLPGDVLDLTSGTGAYTLAATSAYTTAWYEQDRRLARPQTYFTKYLADLVEAGIPGQLSLLRMNQLFRQLRDNLAKDGRPVPQSRAVDDAREFAFAYNAAAEAQPAQPPAARRPDRSPRRRLLVLALACTVIAAAIAVPLALAAPGSTQTPKGTPLILTDSNSKGVTSVAFKPDSPDLAAADANGGVYLWDTASGKQVGNGEPLIDPGSDGVYSVAFAPSGQVLAAADGNHHIYLWNTATAGQAHAPVPLAEPDSQAVTSVAFAPDGTTLAAANDSGHIYLIDATEKKVTADLTSLTPAGVLSVAFGSDGTTLAATSDQGKFYVLDLTGSITFSDPAGQGSTSVAFAPDSTTLAVGDSNGSVYVWRGA